MFRVDDGVLCFLVSTLMRIDYFVFVMVFVMVFDFVFVFVFGIVGMI